MYLGELMAHGALEFRPLDKRYFITNKGRALLSAYGQYKETAVMLENAWAELTHFFSTKADRPPLAAADRLPSLTRRQKYHF